MVSPNHVAAKEVDLLCPDHHLIWYGLIVDSGPRTFLAFWSRLFWNIFRLYVGALGTLLGAWQIRFI